MKKILLALALLALVVALAVVKDWRQETQIREVFAEGLEEGKGQTEQLSADRDSLVAALDGQSARYRDSIAALEAHQASQIDSLRSVVNQKDSAIEDLSSELSATRAAGETRTQADAADSRDKKIMDRYKQRYRQLPRDLSAYERRVALSEIREETAKEFKISVKQLNNLRSKYGLDY